MAHVPTSPKVIDAIDGKENTIDIPRDGTNINVDIVRENRKQELLRKYSKFINAEDMFMDCDSSIDEHGRYSYNFVVDEGITRADIPIVDNDLSEEEQMMIIEARADRGLIRDLNNSFVYTKESRIANIRSFLFFIDKYEKDHPESINRIPLEDYIMQISLSSIIEIMDLI